MVHLRHFNLSLQALTEDWTLEHCESVMNRNKHALLRTKADMKLLSTLCSTILIDLTSIIMTSLL